MQEWMVEKNSTTWESWLWNNNVSPWGNRTLEEAQANPANGVAYSRPYSDNDIAGAGPGTDWLGLITRDGQIQEHNVNLQGGSESTQYMVSFNYYDHQGIVKNSGMTRYTAKANIDQKFLNIFKAGLNLTLSRKVGDFWGSNSKTPVSFALPYRWVPISRRMTKQPVRIPSTPYWDNSPTPTPC